MGKEAKIGHAWQESQVQDQVFDAWDAGKEEGRWEPAVSWEVMDQRAAAVLEVSEHKRGDLRGIKVKEESEKVGLKLNIQKTKIMASGPITSWQIDGETVETVSDFIFWGSQITADGDCSHEIKRHSLEEKLWPT